MASRKVNTEGIDEELLIASIGKKRSEEQMPPPVQEQSVQGQKEKSYAPTRRDAGGKRNSRTMTISGYISVATKSRPGSACISAGMSTASS